MEYAVIKINSKQYIVSENSSLRIDRVTVDTPVEVLGSGTEDTFELGANKAVILEIIQDLKDKKILVRRYKSKSRYRKEKGHRQPISILKVKSIKEGGSSKVVLAKEVKTTQIAKSESTSQEIKIEDMDITDKQKELLISNGYKTSKDILTANKDDVLAIKGLGEKAYDKIIESLN